MPPDGRVRIMTEERGSFEHFSLLGGPLHRLGSRLGLVRRGTNTLPLGLMLGILPWAVLVALAVVDGVADQLFSPAVIGWHVRLLVAIPLFFLCESLLDPQLRAFVGLAVRSGVVPEEELPALESAIASTGRRKNSWLAEGICLMAAVLLPVVAFQLNLGGGSATEALSQSAAVTPLVGWWYGVVCLPLFRFLMFRWLWRLGLWWYFLWRMARMNLHLVPTHPCGAAGLGYLEVVQGHFAPLVVALSAVVSAIGAEGLIAGTVTLEGMTPAFVWLLFLDAALFLGPLFLFTPKLGTRRMKGLSDYTVLANNYVTAFERKWIDANGSPGEPLLGTADLQSLADLSASFSNVRNMRWAPVSLRLLGMLLAAALGPMLPLVFLQYPAGELAKKLFLGLVGL